MPELIKLGVSKVTLTVRENGDPMAVADQACSNAKGVSLFQHQCNGGSFEDALKELLKRAKSAAGVPSRFDLEIVDPPETS